MNHPWSLTFDCLMRKSTCRVERKARRSLLTRVLLCCRYPAWRQNPRPTAPSSGSLSLPLVPSRRTPRARSLYLVQKKQENRTKAKSRVRCFFR